MHFVPANLSCLFTIHPHPDPRWAGTCGVGFTVTEGVTATVKQTNQGAITMSYNNKDCLIKPVEEICQMLHVQDVHIELTSPFPLGAGFGMSGASTLATAYALVHSPVKRSVNHCESSYPDLRSEDCLSESLTLSPRDERVPQQPQQASLDSCRNKKRCSCYDKNLAILAHTAEAKHKTGLGDIVNQYYRGFLVKTTSSAHFEAERISIDQKIIYYKIYAPKDAQDGLESINRDILNKAGEKALARVQVEMKTNQPASLHRIFSISKQFCEEAGLLTNTSLQNTIHEIEKNGGAATRILLGNAIMSTSAFPGSQKIIISE
jgi:pantoate kinase